MLCLWMWTWSHDHSHEPHSAKQVAKEAKVRKLDVRDILIENAMYPQTPIDI